AQHRRARMPHRSVERSRRCRPRPPPLFEAAIIAACTVARAAESSLCDTTVANGIAGSFSDDGSLAETPNAAHRSECRHRLQFGDGPTVRSELPGGAAFLQHDLEVRGRRANAESELTTAQSTMIANGDARVASGGMTLTSRCTVPQSRGHP